MRHIVGTGDPSTCNCGVIKFYHKCSCGHTEPIYYNCSSYSCPFCYKNPISRSSDQISSRLYSIYSSDGKKQSSLDFSFSSLPLDEFVRLHSSYDYYHWVFSPSLNEFSKFDSLSDVYRFFKSVFDEIIQEKFGWGHVRRNRKSGNGLIGAVIFHPYRISESGKEYVKKQRELGAEGGSWDILHRSSNLYDHVYFSPHFHLVVNGLIPLDFQARQMIQGRILKRVRRIKDSDDCNRVISYLLTHAGYEKGKKIYRYIIPRDYTFSQFKVITSEVVCICPKCGLTMKEFRPGDLLDNCPDAYVRVTYFKSKLKYRHKRSKKND